MRKVVKSIVQKQYDNILSIVSGIGGQFFLVISGIISAYVLNIDDRGYLALLMLYPVLFSILGLAGIPQGLTYHIAKDQSSTIALLRQLTPLIILQLIISIALHEVFIALYYADSNESIKQSAFYSSFAIIGIFAFQYGIAILQGLHEFTFTQIARIFNTSFFSLILFILFLIDRTYLTLNTMILLWAIIQLIAGIATIYLVYLKLKNSKAEERKLKINNIIRFSIKSFFGYNSFIDTFKVDQAIVGHFLGTQLLGYYVVAQSFSNLPKIISFGLNMIYYPKITKYETKKKIVLESIYTNTLISLAICTLLFFLTPYLIRLIFQEKFIDSIIIAQILIGSSFFYSIRRSITEALRALNYPEIATHIEFLYFILFILIFFLLYKSNPLSSPALALLFSSFLTLIVVTRILKAKI